VNEGADDGLAQVSAGVQAAIAAYTHALDDGRTDDVVAAYCPDGFCDMPGLGRHVGHEALRRAYGQLAPNGGRHLVFNTDLVEWDDAEATVRSDVVLLMKGERGWKIGVVGRYDDVLHRTDGTWRFHSRVAEFD
jgi:SnoaL-like domain